MLDGRLALLAMACFGLLVPGLSPASPAEYTITRIAAPGATYTAALAINERGQVAGYATMPDGTRTAYVYTAGAFTFADMPAAEYLWVSDIDEDGNIVGTYNLPPDSYERARAFAWIDGVFSDLGDLGIDDDARATAMDRHGVVFGTSGSHVFAWRDGRMRDLGAWGDSFDDEEHDVTVVTDVNAQGAGVGYALDFGRRTIAFVAERGRRTKLPNTLGGEHVRAYAINDHGTICGWAYTANGRYHAFRYENGGMTDLGILPDGPHSEARAINDAGDVVGFSGTTRGERAFIARAGSTQMEDLNVAADAKPQKWILMYAWGINDRGEIVGSGNQGGYLLTPVRGAGRALGED